MEIDTNIAEEKVEEIFFRSFGTQLYDCSKEAIIKFLNANGYRISNFKELTAEIIDFLVYRGKFDHPLDLYTFARKNGLHNKPVRKFSADEENSELYLSAPTLYYRSSHYNYDFAVRGLENLKNLSGYADVSAGVAAILEFNGCDDDTYFWIVKNSKIKDGRYIYDELVEVHIDQNPDRKYFDDKLGRWRFFKTRHQFTKTKFIS